MTYTTEFGSLKSFSKGRVEPIGDDPRHYAFSNLFEVASNARAYEKVAVAKNLEYVIEAIRAEGVSEWRIADHDETALIMDGTVIVELFDLDNPDIVASGTGGSVRLEAEPVGTPMGHVVAGRGHMVLLPAKHAYRFRAAQPSVLLLQTIAGVDTVERWATICQTML
ncbi:MAG: hydroxyquinol 1,2-dioxygenase [Acidimicrobiales bacterium]